MLNEKWKNDQRKGQKLEREYATVHLGCGRCAPEETTMQRLTDRGGMEENDRETTSEEIERSRSPGVDGAE